VSGSGILDHFLQHGLQLAGGVLVLAAVFVLNVRFTRRRLAVQEAAA